MNRIKYLIAGLFAVALMSGQAQATDAQVSSDTYRASSKSTPFYGRSDGLFYGKTNKVPYLLGNAQPSIVAGSPTYSATFTEGAAKGLQLMDSAGIAFDSTAANTNLLYYAGGFVGVFTTIVDAGATVPAGTATGLDLGAGANNDNDHYELFAGILGASGRPMVVGTEPAFSFCATMTITDVSDTDFLQVGWRNATPVTASTASYTLYASIGIGSATGDVYTNDKTTGAVDTTDGWADAASHELCTIVSGAGVTTYTLDGSAPTVATAYTFTDGAVLLPYVAIRNNAATPDPFDLTKWEVSYP